VPLGARAGSRFEPPTDSKFFYVDYQFSESQYVNSITVRADSVQGYENNSFDLILAADAHELAIVSSECQEACDWASSGHKFSDFDADTYKSLEAE